MAIPPHTFTQHLPNTDVSFDMIHISGGTFIMGAEEDDPDAEEWNGEKGQHEVSLSPFYLSQYPVTQAVFKAVMQGHNPSGFIGEDRPVENISWLEAALFCNQLNETLGLKSCYFADKNFSMAYGKTPRGYELPNKQGEVYIRPDVQGYRLPTDAEWEYAAKAGELCKYAGSKKLKEVGWFELNSHGETKPIGLKYANAFGIYDMSGNVWEWCQDWWEKDYYLECASKGVVCDPTGPIKGTSRVYRGGSWFSFSQYCRVTNRYYWPPGNRDRHVGFRLCLVFREMGVRIRT